MKRYLWLLEAAKNYGTLKEDRTGVGTISMFGPQVKFDLRDGFPLLTTKKVHVKSVVHELLWFLQGDTNIKYLKDNGVSIWDEWADENGDLGPVYGKQWRSWPLQDPCDECSGTGRLYEAEPGDTGCREWPCPVCGGEGSRSIDQLAEVVHTLKTNPDSRRVLVSAWNPAEVEDMALPPCHVMFQFYSRPMPQAERMTWAYTHLKPSQIKELQGCASIALDGLLQELEVPKRELSCKLYQRSADLFLGVPFNIASYALLTHMVAAQTGHAVGMFVHTFGDLHIYRNHLEQVEEQLYREPRGLPRLSLNPNVKSLFDYTFEDIRFHGYDPAPAIKAPVAV